MEIKKELKLKSNYIAGLIFFLTVIIIQIWCIDISVSAMLAGGYVANGFFGVNAMQTYHVALYILLLSCFGIVLLISHHIIMCKYEEKE